MSELGCTARLLRQWCQAWLDFADDVAQTIQVQLGLTQAIFGIGALHLKWTNTGGILKQAAPLFGAQAEGGIDQSLPNDCIDHGRYVPEPAAARHP